MEAIFVVFILCSLLVGSESQYYVHKPLNNTKDGIEKTLWDRMGGEERIRPMMDDVYDLHLDDWMTRKWFRDDNEYITQTRAHVQEHLFKWFSSKTGGPHTYSGRSLKSTHAKIFEQNPMTKEAIYCVIAHYPMMMQLHGVGGDRERDEVLELLYAQVDEITFSGTKTFHNKLAQYLNFNERLVDSYEQLHDKVEKFYDKLVKDPLTREYFKPNKYWMRIDKEVLLSKMADYIMVGTGAKQHKYEGPTLIDAFEEMRKVKPFTKTAMHMIFYHLVETMQSERFGGEYERNEMIHVFEYLRSRVVHASNTLIPEGVVLPPSHADGL